jgi:hypothetical protein
MTPFRPLNGGGQFLTVEHLEQPPDGRRRISLQLEMVRNDEGSFIECDKDRGSVVHELLSRVRFDCIPIWSDIGAAFAAGLACKLILNIRKPHIIRPAVGVHGGGVAAFVVGAVDKDAGNAG